MDKDINKFIKHTIVNLEGALMKDDPQLTFAVLTNLSNVLDSYLDACYMESIGSALESASIDLEIK